jgi:hypothetical protein
MMVPSNVGIFTLQFCKMDSAWEKQDHLKHQPGILSSFYNMEKKQYRDYSVEIQQFANWNITVLNA